MEKKHGSLVLAMRAQLRSAAPRQGPRPSAFVSLRSGMGTLVDTLAKTIAGVNVRLGAPVKAIARGEAGFTVELPEGETLAADAVILAVPAHAASRAVRRLDDGLATELSAIRYASTATAFLAFRRDAVHHPLDAVGFLSPRPLGRPILAATWVTSKWEGRAPEGHVLMRVFFGGSWGQAVLERDDGELARVAVEELRRFVRIDGAPLFTRVFRFDQASPQPLVGHLGRFARIEDRLARWPGLYVAGNGYDGVGIPDCIKQAQRIAARILG
jgi:oxygen-dependent protoporphyrinogen oxidase